MIKFVVFILVIIFISSVFSSVVYASVQDHNNDTKTPIKHVITIYFENHTFDNFFGIYPYDPYSLNENLIKNLSRPLNLLNSSILKNLTPVPANQYSTPDPVEGYTAYHIDWNNGKMNNFINGSGSQSMTYFTSSQLGLEWDLAEEYSIADNYFTPQMSESEPNNYYYIAGFSPAINDYGPPPTIPFSETIFGELNHYGISWNIYVGNESYQNNNFDDMQAYFPASEWADNSYHLKTWYDLIAEAHNNTLPAVSYVFSENNGGYSQGPPINVLKGELWLVYLINEIENSPVWNSTAIFITYDDPGGYYDQVPPPVIDGVQLGMRVLLIVVSPYAKEDYISNTLMTHTSLLAFIDYNWNMPALNKFVSYSNLPLDMFNFNLSYNNRTIVRPPLNFESEPGFPSNISLTMDPENITLNLSSSFPFLPQYPLNSLPYARFGSSNLNLSSISSVVYIKKDVSYIPIYYEQWYFLLLILFGVGLALLIIREEDRNVKR